LKPNEPCPAAADATSDEEATAVNAARAGSERRSESKSMMVRYLP
jgi:hypothetical protein